MLYMAGSLPHWQANVSQHHLLSTSVSRGNESFLTGSNPVSAWLFSREALPEHFILGIPCGDRWQIAHANTYVILVTVSKIVAVSNGFAVRDIPRPDRVVDTD